MPENLFLTEPASHQEQKLDSGPTGYLPKREKKQSNNNDEIKSDSHGMLDILKSFLLFLDGSFYVTQDGQMLELHVYITNSGNKIY